MFKTGWCVAALVALFCVSLVAGCGSGSPSGLTVQAIAFETQAVPGGGAGQLYNVVVLFSTEGGAELPEQFSLSSGVLPPGVTLMADRVDGDADGIPDEDGALTGHARLIGFPREVGSYNFTVKAISTGGTTNPDQPDLSASFDFNVTVVEGTVNVLTPTAAEGTSDPAVPAFDEVIPFVNPANPNAFYSFPFLVAGGSGNNINTIYMPRELELSTFDNALKPVSEGGDGAPVTEDTNEAETTNDEFENDFSDGGWFVLQAGNAKVQVGGFQSPRGPVGTIIGLRAEWFQLASTPQNSRRRIGENLPGGDTTLGTPLPVRFSDYFSPGYKDTHPEATDRAKYPFVVGEYMNAFFVPFVDGVDITPLKFRIIVESVDTKGTLDKADDEIIRRAYIVRVQIPDITIDTVALPAGQVGVDYTEILAAAGGVPPLSYDLEYIDGVADATPTENTPGSLNKTDFGLEMNTSTGQFFGFGRAEGSVDITVRVFAAVMNPVQNGPVPIPTGGAGEVDGTLPLTGKKGRHKTITVDFTTANPIMVANASLTPAVDGFAYPSQAPRIAGLGGAPWLVPDPVGFIDAPFPSNATRNYTISAEYVRDASHGADEGVVDPDRELPNALVLDGVPTSPTNGVISGVAFDRGFHPVKITISDRFLGAAAAPVGPVNSTFRDLALSVSPDTAIYMRGVPGATGEPTGLLDPTLQIGEARMVPMMTAATMFTADTGASPRRFAAMPDQADILPVMLCHGGEDTHSNKGINSISGYFPPEHSSEIRWDYFNTRAWQHLQQEHVWLQPANSPVRVFLWAETRTKKWNSNATSGGDSKRYQQYDTTGDRGILCINPVSGDFWFVCTLSNSTSTTNDEGEQFGADVVIQHRNNGSSLTTGGYYGSDHIGYWQYYYNGQLPSRHSREVLAAGLGSFIEGNSNTSSNNWYRTNTGRSATSVAMSDDGIWCATALPGGSDDQKILIWRTDKMPIPDAILAQGHVEGKAGTASDGTVLANLAAVVTLSGSSFDQDGGGAYIMPSDLSDREQLNADSLCFVEGGLIFTSLSSMDRVFGISLVDGHLSTRRLNFSRSAVGTGGTTSATNASSTRGQYVPDQDYLKGGSAPQSFAVQFAFTGNKADDGELGPNRVAFVAGNTTTFNFFNTGGTSNPATPNPGKNQRGNQNMALLVLDDFVGGSGLALDDADLYDMTGNSSLIYGDLLTPGRAGEELDWVKMSPDGRFMAVVRDRVTGDTRTSSFTFYVPTFATPSSSSSWSSSDDLMVMGLDEDGDAIDMDADTTADEHVLFIGTRSLTANGSAASHPSYAESLNVINGRFKRVTHLQFSEDSETLFFVYASDSTYPVKYYGSTSGWAINPEAATSTTFRFGTAMIVQFDFRTSTGGAHNFTTAAMSSYASNALQGFSPGGGIGPTTPPFNDTHGPAEQQFWAMFRSANGSILYFISDQMSGRTYMVGFNMTNDEINGYDTFEPFSPHAATVGFRQFECNSWGYEGRFFSVPAGTTYAPSGRDGDGLVLIVGNDASAGATNATDLEIYVFDSNNAGDLIAISSAVTPGTRNAISYMYMSADGNFVVFHRAETTSNSRDNRGVLTGNTDLCCVNNLHAVVFEGAAPNAFVLSGAASHGATTAFVGEGTSTGAQALIFSSAPAGANASWDDRTLKITLLAPGTIPTTLDSTTSHYVILGGTRLVADAFLDAN